MTFLFFTLLPLRTGCFFFFTSHSLSLFMYWIINLFLLMLTKGMFHHNYHHCPHYLHDYYSFLGQAHTPAAPVIIRPKCSCVVCPHSFPGASHVVPDAPAPLLTFLSSHLHEGQCQAPKILL